LGGILIAAFPQADALGAGAGGPRKLWLLLVLLLLLSLRGWSPCILLVGLLVFGLLPGGSVGAAVAVLIAGALLFCWALSFFMASA
jgi:hypothetical protein